MYTKKASMEKGSCVLHSELVANQDKEIKGKSQKEPDYEREFVYGGSMEQRGIAL